MLLCVVCKRENDKRRRAGDVDLIMKSGWEATKSLVWEGTSAGSEMSAGAPLREVLSLSRQRSLNWQGHHPNR